MSYVDTAQSSFDQAIQRVPTRYDSGFDTLGWHDWLLDQSVVPISPYNPRNTDDPPDIEYRVEERIKEHTDIVRLWQRQLDETYAELSWVETAIGVCNDLGLRTPRSEAEHASSHASSSLFVSDWPSHSPITIEETMSPAQPSRYENSSAPPPTNKELIYITTDRSLWK